MKAERYHQMTFEEGFARPITPSADVTEPMLWFEEVYLMHRLGAGLNKETCIRHFKFQRGLNILWAEPEDPKAAAGLYRDGIAGHSTGKTLFCRILRYLIGEPNFGTDDLSAHVRETFKELWAVASVRLNKKRWIVGRALSGQGTDFAILDGAIAPVFEKEPNTGEYARFTSALESYCGAPLSRIHPEEAWRHLRPWIARDQEARFSNITAWRDSLSEADNPRTSAAAQHLIMRAVLRLLDPEEYDTRLEMAKLEDQIRVWNNDLPMKQSLATNDRRHLERTLKLVPKVTVDLANLIAAKEHIESQRTIREESLEHFESQPESTEVSLARRNLSDAVAEKNRVGDRIKTLTEEIPQERKLAADELLTIERIKTKGFKDGKRVADNYCPNSYIKAQERNCVPKAPGADDASMVEISELEAQAKSRAALLESKEGEKARLETRSDQLVATIQTRETELRDTLVKYPPPAIAIQREIAVLENAEQAIEAAIKSGRDETTLDKNLLTARDNLEKSRQSLVTHKRDAETRLEVFSDIFADVVRAVLGQSVSASTDLTERGIIPHVKRNRELGGAALETIKTLAFDLASVVHSMEGKGDHPRFLIHDGPREADMARVVYERFFTYARRMEECHPEDQATFQYILTTTTHPPEGMQEGSPWLLGEKLSAKTKAGRLLKEDF